MTEVETSAYILSFDESQEAKDRAWEILKKWFLEEEMFTGESIHQMDVTYEDAPELLTDVAEKAFRFDCKWK